MTSPLETQPAKPVRLIVERNRLVKEESIVAFFTKLRAKVGIGKIFYPGPGFDDSLGRVFSSDEVVYIDREPRFPGVPRGLYEQTGLADESVDAVFLQDTHQKPKELTEFLRALKRGGLLIQSLYGCGIEPTGIRVENVLRDSRLLGKDILPEWKHLFITLEKV